MKIKRLSEYAVIPTQGTQFSAGYDLYFAAPKEETITIPPNENRMIPTGWAFKIPKGGFGAIFARSGLAKKQSLRPANCVGVIDADYRGEVMVCLHNDSNLPQIVHGQERIAQLILIQHEPLTFKEVDELDPTDRSSGGFGSTGI